MLIGQSSICPCHTTNKIISVYYLSRVLSELSAIPWSTHPRLVVISVTDVSNLSRRLDQRGGSMRCHIRPISMPNYYLSLLRTTRNVISLSRTTRHAPDVFISCTCGATTGGGSSFNTLPVSDTSQLLSLSLSLSFSLSLSLFLSLSLSLSLSLCLVKKGP
eukprot:sb/3472826/